MEKSPAIKVHRVTDLSLSLSLSLSLEKSTFKFSQTVGEMVFVSFEVEKMRMFLVQSIVRWCWVLVRSLGCSSLLPRVKPLTKVWFQLALVSWPSCRQQARSLFMHGHGRAAFPLLLQFFFFIADSGPLMPYFSKYQRPSLLIPAPLALTEI